MNRLKTLISKWVVEDKMNDQALGQEVRKFYWKEIHSYENWLHEDIEEDTVWGSNYSDDGGDEIY